MQVLICLGVLRQDMEPFSLSQFLLINGDNLYNFEKPSHTYAKINNLMLFKMPSIQVFSFSNFPSNLNTALKRCFMFLV